MPPWTDRRCSIEGCDRKHFGRDLCSMHYIRVRRHGDPNYVDPRGVKFDPTDPEAILLAKRQITATGCWEWTGDRTTSGYGQVRPAGKRIMVTRLAHETWIGPIPEGQWILHHCDNPPCYNPAHIYAGTPKQNAADMVRRGRARGGSLPPERRIAGQRWSARLTPDAVLEIRRRRAAGATKLSLAREFGVTPPSITKIVNWVTWRHVK